MSDTPRTDAIDCSESPDTNGLYDWKHAYFQLLPFAKGLERENAELHAELATASFPMKKCLDFVESELRNMARIADGLRRENAGLRQAVGLASTIKPDMEIDALNPVGMMQEVVALVAELQRGNLCSLCAGKGNPVNGKPCVCGGSGKALDAVPNLLSVIDEFKNQNAELRRDAERWKRRAEFEYAKRVYPDDLRLGYGALDAGMQTWEYEAAIDAAMKGPKPE